MGEKQLCNSDRSTDLEKLAALWDKLYPGKNMPTDRLDLIMKLQVAFLHLVYSDNNNGKPGQGYNSTTEALTNETQYYIGAVHNELEEIRDWLPWKSHKKYPPDFKIDRSELIYEVIDCIHYLLNILTIWGVETEEFFEMFLHKNIINWERKGAKL